MGTGMPFKSRHVILYTAGLKNLVKVKLRQDVHDKINFSQILSKNLLDKNNLYSICMYKYVLGHYSLMVDLIRLFQIIEKMPLLPCFLKGFRHF